MEVTVLLSSAEYAVLRTLGAGRATVRDLAVVLHLSPSWVKQVVRELVVAGRVEVAGWQPREGRVGRRARYYRLTDRQDG